MSVITPAETEFLEQLNSTIAQQLSNSQFGVEELADAMNMSRSNLLRKVKKLTGMSVNEMIAKARLAKALELLKTTSMNVSEVGDATGFSSTSYFIKCFKEEYGYSPGKTGEQPNIEQQNVEVEPKKVKWATVIIAGAVVLALAIILVLALTRKSEGPPKEKSIAVLPFKNESSDSSNIYLINGLMESTLNNLQQIGNLKVISRTTSEKYRNTKKSIPDMAKELNVNYFIEGSGQKIGDKILLNIQLIEAATDRHLWAKQYRRESSDIFELQHEIAKNIADEIEVVITPEEERRITKKPTNNIVAYDYFLKGKELFYRSGRGDLDSSLHYFAKAIEYDSTFALAYATTAMVDYYLDMFMVEKKHTRELDSCANRAISLDPNIVDSYIAKGVAHAAKKEYPESIKYLEKAHELDPNSGLVIHFLTEFYSIHAFNTAKYLEYALIGVKIDRESPVDSATTSFKYFHLANAFMGAGFIDEALMYVDKSIAYNPGNPFAKYFRPFVFFAKDNDVKRTRNELIDLFRKDSTRVDIAQQIANLYFRERDYKNSYKWYNGFIRLRDRFHLQVYEGESLRMAVVWSAVGRKEEGNMYAEKFKEFCDADKSIYRHINLASYFAYMGSKDEAIKELRRFVDEDFNYHYWLMLLDEEAYVDSIKDMPEYKVLLKRLKDDFWDNKKKIRKEMEEKGLL